jgi:hypothetical protein
MLKTIFTLLISTISLSLIAQKPHWASSIYISLDASPPQIRYFKNKVVLPSEKKGNTGWESTLNIWEWYPSIGVKLNRSFSIEGGFYERTYFNGAHNLKVPQCGDYFGINSSQDSEVDHYYFRLYYNATKGQLFHKPLKMYLGLGYAYAMSQGPSSFNIAWSFPCDKDTSKYGYYRTNRSIDAIQPNYHLLEASVKMEYQIFRHIGLTFSANYNQGFETIGIYKLDYGMVGGYKGYFESETKGTNFEFCLGLKMYPFASLEQKPKKKKKKVINQARFKD